MSLLIVRPDSSQRVPDTKDTPRTRTVLRRSTIFILLFISVTRPQLLAEQQQGKYCSFRSTTIFPPFRTPRTVDGIQRTCTRLSTITCRYHQRCDSTSTTSPLGINKVDFEIVLCNEATAYSTAVGRADTPSSSISYTPRLLTSR
jgi:hypothetical protein